MNLNQTFASVQEAGRRLLSLSDKEINRVLLAVADAAIEKADFILSENLKDLERMDSSDPKYDRLQLTEARLQAIAADIRKVAALPSPLGRILKESVLPNGLKIKRVSVPFGVIGIIYEARPNVSFDVFSLCLKSGNACILKGGSDADHSNRAIADVIHGVLKRFDVDPHIAELLPSDRESTSALLHADGYVDLIIPRGSSSLINFVRQNATIPVIETGAGVCHAYFDRYGDVEMGASIINNAKTRRVSVCNALDCLIVDLDRLTDLPALCQPLHLHDVVIYADQPAYNALQGKYPTELLRPATEDCYGKEFLDYKMAIKTVASAQEAMAHIRKYSSKHSECIITEDKARGEWFYREADAACVYVNAPTSFTDGAQFGLGAEIGISTQKLHARGPMALEEITTYKWIIEGTGQIREN
ncbi:glutamate-5-semialdehyde dehydrogenase [Bacteroides helcogenes]|uniref:Gamma-glutamyl phosphate reductase n=1 Tax=Bacteroides helcogenes (strain ATCC 35417 / DSM 20613 / JCM 6297 / CCUG 15421 / P 36-108) TaxID=693979 RepID=E6SUE0_BACT6|nr:glutamate-5-semialdehyde dehydrogenase [Bacteroides helcogenes]ADV42358.1 glutamate-5-semialdehyde dehydrogenase [Bacteroides helcogenes P 36-108]MDY5237186.1 glutamate-5-semialdehyde dehydrogenase [Bacteroides helcogenes]